MAKFDVDGVIEMVCNNEMDESDDSNDEFDGYLVYEEMEKLLGECKTDESDYEESLSIECDVNEMEFAVRHELDKMDIDGCDEVESKNDELNELFMDNEVPDEMYVDEYDDSAVSAASSAGPPSTVPSSLPPTISSTTLDDTSTGKCKIDMSNKSLIDFFKLLVTMDVLDNIVEQTNLYGNPFFEKHSAILPSSRLHSWKKKFECFSIIEVSCSYCCDGCGRTSPALLLEMAQNGFGACGAAQVDRKGMPEEWKRYRKGKSVKMNRDVRTKKLDRVMALQWQDKRLITMLTTIYDDKMISKKRRSRFGKDNEEDVNKPLCIKEYNKYMGGVDRSDQLLSYYGFVHKTLKWSI